MRSVGGREGVKEGEWPRISRTWNGICYGCYHCGESCQ